MTDHAELARIRFVTTHFEYLQGLAALPVLAWIALAMAWASDWIGGWLVLAAIPPLAAAAVAAIVHYRRAYGQVRPPRTGTRDAVFLWPVLATVVAAAAVDIAGLTWPVSVEGIVLSGAALAGAVLVRPLTPALLLVGVPWLVVSLIPLGGSAGPHPLSTTEVWILAFCAGSAVLQVWGHLLLRRTLRPRPARRASGT
ncbi:hypothetical protein B0I33_101176 [Prauserella shujinwangii]|uniref:Uncharacterized protein n=1 Tax=Prauserella shujinwangii TaxID=1453103 RepID=A0A2T0M2Q9_9PSEU|nr:hypothetical protein [Prauserella shujinwangii]PRX51024.1 hypothetical protein B0I33_101176 [Prauserella shujinwangii]